MKVGTIPWLLSHDLKIWWRSPNYKPHIVAYFIFINAVSSIFWTLEPPQNDVLITIDNSGMTIIATWLGLFSLALVSALGATVDFASNKKHTVILNHS